MLSVQNLHAYYGRAHILHGVSLEARAGEVVALLGRNGVGKTTTLKTIVGLLKPSAGSVQLDGTPITSLSPEERARRAAWVGAVTDDDDERGVGLGNRVDADGQRVYFARAHDREGINDVLGAPDVEQLRRKTG